jgi:hypothetical protein
MHMIFRIAAAPIVTLWVSVSITAKSDSGSIFLWDGPWPTIRHFLGIHALSDYDLRTIEDQLRKGVKQAFEIDTSETLLTLAGFRPQHG